MANLFPDEVVSRFPRLAEVIGAAWLRQATKLLEWSRNHPVWVEQLEADLMRLAARVGVSNVRAAYRNQLRDPQQLLPTIYEVHGVALFATSATIVGLHVPLCTTARKNYDVRAEIAGQVLHADAKTRDDRFPFNLLPSLDASGSSTWSGSRATIDPHDLAALMSGGTMPAGGKSRGDDGIVHVETPESTVIRQTLQKGLTQLPAGGCNVILFGHIAGGLRNLEEALWGPEVAWFARNRQTGKMESGWTRRPFGAFCFGNAGEPFRGLSAVVWLRLSGLGGHMARAYRIYPNPGADVPLPDAVIHALEGTMREWSTERADPDLKPGDE